MYKELLLQFDCGRLMAQIYKGMANSRPWRIYFNQIGDVNEKDRVKITKNKWACMKRLMRVDEAKKVCQKRSG